MGACAVCSLLFCSDAGAMDLDFEAYAAKKGWNNSRRADVAELNELRGTNSGLKKDNKELRLNNEFRLSQLVNANSNMLNLMSANDEKNAEIERLQGLTDDQLRSDLKDANEKVAQTENARKVADEARINAETQLKEANKKAEDLETDKTARETEKQNLTDQLNKANDEKNAEIEKLRSDLEEANEKVAQQEEQLASKNAEIEELRKINAENKAHYEEQKQKQEELANNLAKQEQTKNILDQRLAKQERNVIKIGEVVSDNEYLENENEQLKNEQEASERVENELWSKLDEYKEKNEQQEAKIEKLTNDLAEANKKALKAFLLGTDQNIGEGHIRWVVGVAKNPMEMTRDDVADAVLTTIVSDEATDKLASGLKNNKDKEELKSFVNDLIEQIYNP